MKFEDISLILIFLVIFLMLTKKYIESELKEKLPPFVIAVPYLMILFTFIYVGINQVKNKNHNKVSISSEKQIKTKKTNK